MVLFGILTCALDFFYNNDNDIDFSVKWLEMLIPCLIQVSILSVFLLLKIRLESAVLLKSQAMNSD